MYNCLVIGEWWQRSFSCTTQQMYRNLFCKTRQKKKQSKNWWPVSKRSWCGSKEWHQRSYRFGWPHFSPPPTMSRSKNTHIGISAERFLRVCLSSVAQADLENTASTCLPHHKQTVPHSWHNLCSFIHLAQSLNPGFDTDFLRGQPLLEKQNKM